MVLPRRRILRLFHQRRGHYLYPGYQRVLLPAIQPAAGGCENDELYFSGVIWNGYLGRHLVVHWWQGVIQRAETLGRDSRSS